jgi:5-methylcytosine-specific restriction endonuclease McrA
MSRHTPDGRQYRKHNKAMLAGGPTCWRCGHPGADQAGHIIPASIAPELAKDPANRRPEHGVRGCPTCGAKCNQQAGTKLNYRPSPRSRRW